MHPNDYFKVVPGEVTLILRTVYSDGVWPTVLTPSFGSSGGLSQFSEDQEGNGCQGLGTGPGMHGAAGRPSLTPTLHLISRGTWRSPASTPVHLSKQPKVGRIEAQV